MFSYPSSFYGPTLLLLVPEEQCVCGHWMRSRKNSGYKRIFAGFFFQGDQVPRRSRLITCPSCTHSKHSQGVKMKLCNISTASELLWGEGMLQLFSLQTSAAQAWKVISKTYSTLFPCRSFLMLGNSLQWSYKCHHSLKDLAPVHCSKSFPAKGRAFFL